MGKVYFPLDHTPEEWRKMASECYRKEQESFDRSDTDGFLSQWALTMTGRLYDLLAEVSERGGTWEFTELADAEGNLIEGARKVRTKYGTAWVTPDGRWFNPSRHSDDAERERRNREKGFSLVRVTRPAVVVMAEGGLWGLEPIVIPRKTN